MRRGSLARRYRLSSRAARDALGIARDGLARYGKSHAYRYYAGLFACFGEISEYPEASRVREGFERPLRFHPYEAHVIVCEIRGDEALIVRLLHQRRDRLRHL